MVSSSPLLALSLRSLALVGFAAAAAGQTGMEAGLPAITTPPAVVPSLDPTIPLAATITLQTDVPTRITLLVEDGTRSFLIPDAEPEFKHDHAVPLLGVLPNRTTSVTVVAINRDGKQIAAERPVTFVSPQLPADFPPIRVNRLDPTGAEPGFTIFAPRSSTPGGGPAELWTVILDHRGRVVWYMKGRSGAERSRDGHLFIASRRNRSLQEIDLRGNVLNEWYAAGLDGGAGADPGAILIDTDSLHHEFIHMPEGADSDFVALSSELQVLTGYPASETDLSQTSPMENVIGDVIVEFTRDGTIVREKYLLDILDPYRIAYDGLTGGYWNADYGPPTRDWSHANSLVYDSRDDTYIVSVRHQDCIVKIRRDTPGTGSPDDLVWILGTHDGWRSPWREKLLAPTGPRYAVNRQGHAAQVNELEFEWQFHQHAAVINPFGNLLCFDNGNYRTSPPDPAAPQDTWYSRAVEYRVFPRSMSVQQVWAAGGKYDPEPDRIGFSFFVSNAEYLPLTGNILVNGGGTRDFASGTFHVRIQELTRTNPPDSVLDVTVRAPANDLNWNAYRAHKIDRIYPREISTDELQLHVGPVDAAGRIELLAVGDVRPGETVWFAFSEVGPDGGSCHFSDTLCLDIQDPVQIIGSATVRRNGRASLAIPPGLDVTPPSDPVHVQAAILRGPDSVTSNVITTLVR